eukprot:318500_1
MTQEINYAAAFKQAVDGGTATWHGHNPANQATGTGAYTVVYFPVGTGNAEAHIHDDVGLPDNVSIYPIGGLATGPLLTTIFIKTGGSQLNAGGLKKLQDVVAHEMKIVVDTSIKVSKKKSKLGKMLKKYGISWKKVKTVPNSYAQFEKVRNSKTGGVVSESDQIYLKQALKENAGRSFVSARSEQYDDTFFERYYDDNNYDNNNVDILASG